MCSGHLTTTDGRVLGRHCLTSCPACPSMVACLPGSLRQMDRLPSGPPFSLQTALASGTSFPDGLSDGVEALVTPSLFASTMGLFHAWVSISAARQLVAVLSNAHGSPTYAELGGMGLSRAASQNQRLPSIHCGLRAVIQSAQGDT